MAVARTGPTGALEHRWKDYRNADYQPSSPRDAIRYALVRGNAVETAGLDKKGRDEIAVVVRQLRELGFKIADVPTADGRRIQVRNPNHLPTPAQFAAERGGRQAIERVSRERRNGSAPRRRSVPVESVPRLGEDLRVVLAGFEDAGPVVECVNAEGWRFRFRIENVTVPRDAQAE